MGALSFLGCLLTAYGPSSSIFIIFLAKDAQNALVMVGSALFFLLSNLCASLIWYFATDIRSSTLLVLTIGVLFQEVFRYLFFLVLRKANAGLFNLTKIPITRKAKIQQSFAAGFGYGFMSSLISYISILAETSGPGMQTCASCSSIDIAIIAAIVNCLFSLLHITWGMMSFYDWDSRFWILGILQTLIHLGASFSTTLIGSTTMSQGCFISIGILFGILVIESLSVYSRILRKRKSL